MSENLTNDDSWYNDDEITNGSEEAVYDDSSAELSAGADWEDEYVTDIPNPEDEYPDASFYEPPHPPLGDDEFDDGSFYDNDDWIRNNWWRILVVVILLLITLALLLRSCNGNKNKAAPTPFPTPAVTPLATFTPTPVQQTAETPQTGVQPVATTAPVAEQPTQAPAPTTAPATGGKFAINQVVEVYNTGKDRLSFRAGPGAKYARLALLTDGTKLTVIGGPESAQGHTWWRLQRSDATIGWAIEDNLRPAQ